MIFSKLTEYFEKLEQTSSRLTLIEVLADLFNHAKEDEIDKIIYLTQGRVAPFYAPIEIGMADKMVGQSIALAFGLEKEEVLKAYDKRGDLGLVAYELSKHKRHKGKKADMSVSEVFTYLTKIAQTGGDGSVEKKITLLKDLLEHANAISVKHLVRIPLGNNRLGIGDPTILDGLATAKFGERTQRKLLEKAYNETSDLGLIGKTFWKEGLDGIRKLKVTVGRPIRSELCERLPNTEKVFEKMDVDGQGVHASPKFDGFRVQIHKNGNKIEMFSRNLEDMTHMFPDLIEGVKKQVKAASVIFDSEALAYQKESEEFLPFQETTKRRRKHNIEEAVASLPLRAFVFDILYYKGESLVDKSLVERLACLKKAINGDETLIPASGEILHKPAELQTLLEESISKGLEGVVAKRPDSLYEAGARNFNWVKLKRHSAGELHDTIDCVILGYIFGKGKRTVFGAGALLVGLYDDLKDEFVTVSKIGTGLSDEEWTEIHKRADKIKVDHKPARVNSLLIPSVWVRPQIVIEVLADEITRSPLHTAGMNDDNKINDKLVGFALRFPRLVSFRDKDKKPEDATTVKELIEMYKLQMKK